MGINKKILRNALVASAICAIYIAKTISSKSIEEKKIQPSLAQYLNRLKEFYDTEIIDLAEDKFLNFIDFGISPSAAFEILVEEGI